MAETGMKTMVVFALTPWVVNGMFMFNQVPVSRVATTLVEIERQIEEHRSVNNNVD